MNRHWPVALVMCIISLGVKAQTDESTLHLFPEEMKTEASPIVYDFLERYLYEVSKSKRGYDFYQKMADDKVIIREGTFDNIPKLSSDVVFEIERFEDKGYGVCWKDTLGRTLLSLLFPIKYELLLGMPKVEIEKTMKEQLKACADTTVTSPIDSLTKWIDGNLCSSLFVEHYYAKSLNTAKYYHFSGGEGEDKAPTLTPLFSSEHRAYSAANLFHGLISNTQNYQLHIEQNLYGLKQQSYTIKLDQWLNYCRDNQLTVYFGIEEERVDGLKALLIAVNSDLGYNHMMSIILPDNFVEKDNTVLKAVLNAYIPTDNVKDLYQQYTKKEKKVL